MWYLSGRGYTSRITTTDPSQSGNTYTVNRVFADEDMVATVFRNILSNSIKFSYEDSNIFIDVKEFETDNSYFVVGIQDFGVGMTPSTQNNLFKAKTISSTHGTKKESGTGLGLIVVRDFLLKHNCKVWVKSEVGNGSTFYFTLPRWKTSEQKIDNVF